MTQQRSEKLSCSEINGVLRSDKRMRISGSGAYLQTGRAFVPAHPNPSRGSASSPATPSLHTDF